MVVKQKKTKYLDPVVEILAPFADVTHLFKE